MRSPPSAVMDFWNVNDQGLIVMHHDDGRCGLYVLVGENNEPVENDLDFIEIFADEGATVHVG